MTGLPPSSSAGGCLKNEDLKYIETIIKRWTPTIDYIFHSKLLSYLMVNSQHIMPLTQLYLSKIKRYAPWMFEHIDLIVEGYGYYISGLLFGICHYERLEKLHGIRTFSICEDRIFKASLVCIIADYILDNPELRSTAKSQMEALIISYTTKVPYAGPVDAKVKSAFDLLEELIKTVPGSLSCVIKTFYAELNSVKQQTQDLTTDQLFDIESNKGIMTYEFIGVFINNGTSLSVPREFGLIIQLLDDIADIHIDIRDRTQTVVLNEIKTDGTIDRIIHKIIACIDALPSHYWIFKILGCLVVGSMVSTNPYVSSELTNILKPYAPLCDRGKDHDNTPMFRDAFRRHFEYNIKYM